MSAKLVGAHVKDGLQMAKQHGLPSKVRDIIEQHHGTKLAMYFYHQACKGGCDGQVTEDDFRYPGPRPQTKEAALIMLADAVEAAVRSADDHSSEGIARIVNKIVNDTVLEGQLNESDLSLRDIQTTKDAFASVLQGIFHPRIKYPESEDNNGSESREPRTAPADESAAERTPTPLEDLALKHGEHGSRARD
jgi:membrane-associated HD superfamily phosphohydrolase